MTVTVWSVSQLVLVNVSGVGDTVPSLVSLLASAMETLAEGVPASFTLKVSVVPSSPVSRVGVSMITDVMTVTAWPVKPSAGFRDWSWIGLSPMPVGTV